LSHDANGYDDLEEACKRLKKLEVSLMAFLDRFHPSISRSSCSITCHNDVTNALSHTPAPAPVRVKEPAKESPTPLLNEGVASVMQK
jgi:hypothetical protein